MRTKNERERESREMGEFFARVGERAVADDARRKEASKRVTEMQVYACQDFIDGRTDYDVMMANFTITRELTERGRSDVYATAIFARGDGDGADMAAAIAAELIKMEAYG